MKVFMPMANLDFAALLNEAVANTTTGDALLNKYRRYMLTNESSCTVINNFVKEARNCMFDNGVASVMETICNTINENKIGWQLNTACEAVNCNGSKFNFLNRNAARQVEDLLEGKSEDEIVKYIKAGALKNIMFCEAFRSIVKGVYENAQTVITDEYAAIRPISFIEENDGNTYFEIVGHIYKINEDRISEASVNEVSRNFIECTRVLESNNSKFEDDKLTIIAGNAEYTIAECGECGGTKCTRKTKKKDEVKEQVFDNPAALREHNRLVVSSVAPKAQLALDQQLESVAKCFECFDHFVLLDNSQIVMTRNDKFLVIENHTNAFAMSLCSNHTNAWKVNTNITEALEYIKDKTHVDIKKDYHKNIEESFVKRSEEEVKQLQEAIELDAIEARKKKVQELTEQYKDQPEKLAVLSQIAEELQAL